MVTSTDIALWFYNYYYEQQRYFFRTTWYIILAGQVLYLIVMIAWIISLQKKSDSKEKKMVPKDWVSLFSRSGFFIIISMVNNIFAVTLAAYMLMAAGIIVIKMARIMKYQIFKYVGILIYPITPVIGLSILIYILLKGQDLGWETLGIGVATILITIKHFKLPEITTLNQFLTLKTRTIWNRTPRMLKISGFLLLIAIPMVGYGFVSTNLFSANINYMVPMRDGVRLMTRVYFPPNWNGEARPILMCRTPYGSEGARGYVNEYCTQQGFIVVLQDMRGRYASEGVFPVFESDNTDGNDTIAWLMQHSWCDGRIASIGGSAVCTNQYYYHAEGPNGMKTANLWMGAPELYDYWFFPGGCYRKGFSDWWLPAVTDTEQMEILWAHPTKDSYWANSSLEINQRYRNVDVRALHIGGWYDVFQQGTLAGFQYYNYYGTANAKNHQILIMTPWSHGSSSIHPNVTYPDNEGMEIIRNAERFLFDEQLRGIEQDWDNQPRVYYYVMGYPGATGSGIDFNRYRTAMDWPLTNITKQAWYFHSDGTLSTTVPSITSNASYLYNPMNPVQTMGGTVLLGNSQMGAMDQRPVETDRSDILSYQSAILTSPVEIIGEIKASLFISSNCSDTDFTVKLMDVYPDGTQMIVASGILKTRYRGGFTPDKVALMTPGEIYELSVSLWSTAYRFVPGNRIRISISSSNYPEFSINPNTGGTVYPTFTDYNYANNTIVLGKSGSLSAIWFPRNI